MWLLNQNLYSTKDPMKRHLLPHFCKYSVFYEEKNCFGVVKKGATKGILYSENQTFQRQAKKKESPRNPQQQLFFEGFSQSAGTGVGQPKTRGTCILLIIFPSQKYRSGFISRPVSSFPCLVVFFSLCRTEGRVVMGCDGL